MVEQFSISDLAQQVVGSFLLGGPFVVENGVWNLAKNMTIIHLLMVAILLIIIGYGASYEADENRDLDKENKVGIIPTRLISLILVSYLSVALLIFLLNAPVAFEASLLTTLKTISIVSIFSLIGAATFDTIF